MFSEELLGRADLPRLVVVSVAITGSILLFLNIILVGCFMYRKRKQRLREGVSAYITLDALQSCVGTCWRLVAGDGFADVLYMCYWHSSVVMWAVC